MVVSARLYMTDAYITYISFVLSDCMNDKSWYEVQRGLNTTVRLHNISHLLKSLCILCIFYVYKQLKQLKNNYKEMASNMK